MLTACNVRETARHHYNRSWGLLSVYLHDHIIPPSVMYAGGRKDLFKERGKKKEKEKNGSFICLVVSIFWRQSIDILVWTTSKDWREGPLKLDVWRFGLHVTQWKVKGERCWGYTMAQSGNKNKQTQKKFHTGFGMSCTLFPKWNRGCYLHMLVVLC